MKKIYLSLLALTLFNVAKAQTITAAANQPAIGDTETRNGYDSVAVVPKAEGANMNWNFSAMTLNTQTVSSTYVSTMSIPSSSLFSAHDMVENQGGGNTTYIKTTTTPTTQFEVVGVIVGNALTISYTNSAVYIVWPVTLGSTNTDLYGGPVSGNFTGTSAGTVTSSGAGTGSLTLPGGIQLTNVFQLKYVNKTIVNVTSPSAVTITTQNTDYHYFHASQKSPIVSVSYKNNSGTKSVTITINGAVVLGLNEKNFDATFQIFPNPAKDAFNVKLTNTNNDNGIIEIYNAMGQLTKTVDLGNTSVLEKNISLQDLSTGIYTVRTKVGTRSSSRKLIVE